MKMFDLGGKAALVTGGNGGIGLAMARGLAEAGARVAIAARDEAKAAEALAGLGPEAVFLPVDMGDEASCRAVVEKAEERFGRLDILVNNAGMSIRKQPEELTGADWRRVIDVNLNGCFYTAQAAYPLMKAVGGGKIVNIGSMMSIFGAPFAAAYAASKGGVVQMTKALATAWAKDNIQVNAVLPGWIDTHLTRNARNEVEGLQDRVTARTPAGRWGRPQDLAGIAVFLSSPASDFVTGTAIPVDGGYAVQG